MSPLYICFYFLVLEVLFEPSCAAVRVCAVQKDCCLLMQSLSTDCAYSAWPQHTWKRLLSPVTDLSGRLEEGGPVVC